MPIYELRRQQWVPHPTAAVFDFFARTENLEQLTPDFLRFKITRIPPRMEAGACIEYQLRIHGFPVRWRTIIEKWDPPHQFIDVQEKGPYTLWHHTHTMREVNGGTEIEDLVRYALPFGPLGSLVHRVLVARDVAAIFDYRAAKIREIFP